MIFCIEKNENNIVLFNLEGINNLNKGDIFFRKNIDESLEILKEFEYLDKNYLNSIIDKLSIDEQYDFKLLENKLI